MSLKEQLCNAQSGDERRDILGRGIVDFQTFCNRLEECIEIGDLNVTNRMERNTKTDLFLKAMSRWLEDTNGGDGFFMDKNDASISWRDLLFLIYAASMYE